MSKIDYTKYLFYNDIEEHLLYLADKYPDMIKLDILEETDEGRKIYLAEISENVKSPETKEKGGYYVQGAIHANECGGSSAAMHLIDTLLSQKPDVLKDVVFYIIPRVNPDNVELNMLTNVDARSRIERDLRRLENVVINKDMNGDGKILQMRVKNPLGNYKEVAPGVMIPRTNQDKEGEFYDVFTEGIIENYNGTLPTYSIRNYDYNRCFPTGWQPKPESGEYPLRDKETRAVAEFLVTHPNIFACLDFHNGTNGILFPNLAEPQPNKEDLSLLKYVGNIASEITELPLIDSHAYSGFKQCCGIMNQFCHYSLGISYYTVELGNGLNDIGIETNKPYNYFQSLKAVSEYEEENGNHVFYPFEPFNHPQLGDVEIGGSFRGTGYFMHPKNLAPLVEKTTQFAIKHASMGPELKIDNCEALELGNSIVRIRAQIKNIGIFGTKVIKGTDSYQAGYPVHIYLEGEDKEILSRPNVYEIPSLASMESCYVEWFVKTDNVKNIKIVAAHPKAKTVRKELL